MSSREKERVLDTTELRRMTTIDPLLIREAYVRLPGEYAYANGLYADALQASLHAELRRKQTEARIYMYERARFATTGAKATEAILREHVESADEWVEAKLAEIETEAEMMRLRGICEAMRAKKDMLVSLGAHIRQELDANPFARSQAAGAAEQDRYREDEGKNR